MPNSEVHLQRSRFPDTRWSLVIGAKDGEEEPARMALRELCLLYWRPLYAYIRQSGYRNEDAEDLTQEFLLRVIEKRHLDRADPSRGKLRSFLLTYLKGFLADKRKEANSKKRGGGKVVAAIDLKEAEHRYAAWLSETTTPEVLFERNWALTLLQHALDILERDYCTDGKECLFRALKPSLQWGAGQQSLNQIANQLGMREGAVKVAAFRLRKRYRRTVRELITHTLAEGEEIEEEMRHLFEVLTSTR